MPFKFFPVPIFCMSLPYSSYNKDFPYNSPCIVARNPEFTPSAAAKYMPSENTFKGHVDLINVYLSGFEAISKLDKPDAVKPQMDLLSSATSDLHKFIPYFDQHPSFIKTVDSVYTAINEFLTKNPTVDKPTGFLRVTGLYSTVKNLPPASKKG